MLIGMIIASALAARPAPAAGVRTLALGAAFLLAVTALLPGTGSLQLLLLPALIALVGLFLGPRPGYSPVLAAPPAAAGAFLAGLLLAHAVAPATALLLPAALLTGYGLYWRRL